MSREDVTLLVEILILVAVVGEGIVSYLSYRIMKRKRGRPKRSTMHKLMEKLSKRFRDG